MSRDSVAVLLWLLWHHQGGSSDIGQPIRAMLGMGQHDHLTDAQVAEAKRIGAALTREAAPQASGGDGLLAEIQWRYDEMIAADYDPSERVCAIKDTLSSLLAYAARQLCARLNHLVCATPDSAIQSQQGATGGDGRYARHPILRQHAAQSVAKSGSGAILVSAAAVSDLFADLDAALAHPQAAGSAPVGVEEQLALVQGELDHRTSEIIVVGATALACSPSVKEMWDLREAEVARLRADAKDAARWRHVREMFAEEMLETLFGVDPSVECNATDGLDAACDADIESDAALEKERAE